MGIVRVCSLQMIQMNCKDFRLFQDFVIFAVTSLSHSQSTVHLEYLKRHDNGNHNDNDNDNDQGFMLVVHTVKS